MIDKPVFSWENDAAKIIFTAGGGGLPSQILLKENNELLMQKPQLHLELGDGQIARPYLPEGLTPLGSKYDDAERVEFVRIPWRTESGQVLEHFYLSLRHEFWPDGTAFTTAFFFVEDVAAPDIRNFEFMLPLSLSVFDNVRWGLVSRPEVLNGALIQSARPERFLSRGENRSLSGAIVPLFNFDISRSNAANVHLEFFVEGQNSISGKAADSSTAIKWDNGDAKITWNFQTKQCSAHSRPWQWRNQWGWLISQAPRSRRLPPLKMYHYLDNYQRYPTAHQINKIVAADADVLVLHENWRLDAQNGGVPYDFAEFKRVVEQAHRNNVRIAVYIRGNEISAVEEFCDWFERILKKNYDGLYMDYGGPFHAMTMPDEQFQGGRIQFRQHFLKLRQLRSRVGRNGLLFSHTGPLFSGLGMTDGNIDGYVSGEGERGIMTRSGQEHEYFSGAYVTTGTMWTAAFPEYGGGKMVPFMAASGQFPHSPLGIQFDSSSLAHPREPGINDICFRPLWKLWQTFKGEHDINIFNYYNCSGVFPNQTDGAGHYLMVSEDKHLALLIVTNFLAGKQHVATQVNWGNTGFAAESSDCYLLAPDCNSPGTPTCRNEKNSFSVTLSGYGVAGWLLGDAEKLDKILKDYEKAYPEKDDCDYARLRKVEHQRTLRWAPVSSSEIFMQVGLDNLAVPYEESMWWDLFDNALQIGIFDSSGKFEPRGWITINGFTEIMPEKKDYVWPGQRSAWIPLHQIFPAGKYELGIRSIHLGEPFYSFIRATFSSKPSDEAEDAYNLEFMNELEHDRSFIRFEINIK